MAQHQQQPQQLQNVHPGAPVVVPAGNVEQSDQHHHQQQQQQQPLGQLHPSTNANSTTAQPLNAVIKEPTPTQLQQHPVKLEEARSSEGPEAGSEQTYTEELNENDGGPSKRHAQKGQWQTPPMPIFPSVSSSTNTNNDNSTATASTAPTSAAIPITTTSTTNTATAVNIPSSSDDYAKALQEAYRRGAEAAALLSQRELNAGVMSMPPFAFPFGAPAPATTAGSSASAPNLSAPNSTTTTMPQQVTSTQSQPSMQNAKVETTNNVPQQQIIQTHQQSVVSQPATTTTSAPAPSTVPGQVQNNVANPLTMSTNHTGAPVGALPTNATHFTNTQTTVPSTTTTNTISNNSAQNYTSTQPPQQQQPQPQPQTQQIATTETTQAGTTTMGVPTPIAFSFKAGTTAQPTNTNNTAGTTATQNTLHQPTMPPTDTSNKGQVVTAAATTAPQQQQQLPVAVASSASATSRSLSLPDISSYAARANDEEAKRLKRLARNRASARLRRLRKKNLVESYEGEVGVLESALTKLRAHRWGVGTDSEALLEALSMDRGQQPIDAVKRKELITGILNQQQEQTRNIMECQLENMVLGMIARHESGGINGSQMDIGGDLNGQTKQGDETVDSLASELDDILKLSPDQKIQLQKATDGIEEERRAIETIDTCLTAVMNNSWLLNNGIEECTDQFTSILNGTQMSKFLLWADQNSEAIDQLDYVNAPSATAQPSQSPVFVFGMDDGAAAEDG